MKRMSQYLPALVVALYLSLCVECIAQGGGGGGKPAAPPAKTPATTAQVPYSASDDYPLIVPDGPPTDISDSSAKALLAALGNSTTAIVPDQNMLDALLIAESKLTTQYPWLKGAVDSATSNCKKNADAALLLHFSQWRANGTLKQSFWHFFVVRKTRKSANPVCNLQEVHQPGGKTPEIYAPSHVFFLGIDLLDPNSSLPVATPTYSVTTSATQPQTQSDLSALINAITSAGGGPAGLLALNPGLPGPAATTAGYQIGLAFHEVLPTEPPPFAINVSYFANGTVGATIGNISNCYNSSCSYTRSFPVDDKEYWDVSLGLAIPGPYEAVYKSGTSGTPSSSLKRHTDAYAFLDLYPFAYTAPKASWWPHVNAGVPITSQSLHRPYVGISEGIQKIVKTPIPINVFVGTVFMKQQLFTGIGPTRLASDWATKSLFGVEVPISGITSKLSPKSSKSTSAGKSSAGS